MALKWRWDQGRLAYFQYDNLKSIAQCLVNLDGIVINQKNFDPLRQDLMDYTGLPFAPSSYRVWRNYKRVFECSFLATNVNEQLCVTDFCKRVAENNEAAIDVDEYLSLFIPRFRFPFAAFSDFKKTNELVYPFCAILKYLIFNFLNGGRTNISLEEVFSIIIGNNCSGFEPLASYGNFRVTDYRAAGDENRQVREMLIFISQLSILKWYNGALHLDISIKDYEEFNGFVHLIEPIFKEPKELREEEYLSITSLTNGIVYPFKLQSREAPSDDVFIEGKRTRVVHIKIERSPLLRKLFFERYPGTICDMCYSDLKNRYPWTDNLLEIHHILPLSSTILVTGEGTSLSDIIGVCPNCHKSVHSYYKNWLNNNRVDDFRDKDEAREIYEQAKFNMVL